MGTGGRRVAGHATLQVVQDPRQPCAAVQPQATHRVSTAFRTAATWSGSDSFAVVELQLALQQAEVQEQIQGQLRFGAEDCSRR